MVNTDNERALFGLLPRLRDCFAVEHDPSTISLSSKVEDADVPSAVSHREVVSMFSRFDVRRFRFLWCWDVGKTDDSFSTLPLGFNSEMDDDDNTGEREESRFMFASDSGRETKTDVVATGDKGLTVSDDEGSGDISAACSDWIGPMDGGRGDTPRDSNFTGSSS